MNSPSNPLSSERFDTYQEELAASTTRHSKDADRRAVVTTVLIPQFRAELEKTVRGFQDARGKKSDLPFTPPEVDELCRAVDQIFVDQAELLDVKGLFRPVIAAMRPIRQKVRDELNESFLAHCRNVLAQNKIYDRTALLYRGTMSFKKADFSPFEGHLFFVTAVLGRTIEFITGETLAEIADRLNLPPHSEEQARVYREALAAHGIIDRETLLYATYSDLAKMILPPWGQIFAFFSEILGKPVKKPTIDVRQRVADRIGFPKLDPEQQKAAYRAALAAQGIDDRGTLYIKGIVHFIKMDFPPYGKGGALAAIILGEKNPKKSRELLVRVADAIDLPLVSETRKAAYLAALAAHDIHDRLTLRQTGTEKFEALEFKGIGKGQAFLARVLGKPLRWISHEILDELADAVGFPPLTPEALRQSYREAIANRGITDRASLLKNGPIWFQHATFPPWGMGFNIAGKILRRRVRPTIAVLNEIADVFGW